MISQCFTGFHFIIQEKLLSSYYVDPLLLIGLEGAWGSFYYAVLLPIFQHVECDGPLCHDGRLEDTKGVFEEFMNNKTTMVCSIVYLFSISAFNAFGVNITKYASSAQRATVDSCRTLFIWIFSLILGWETFYWQQLLAFAVLVSGTLIYNEIVVVPIEFMQKNTRGRLEKRDGSMIDVFNQTKVNPEYMDSFHSSFAADSTRNIRNIERKIKSRGSILSSHPSFRDSKQNGSLANLMLPHLFSNESIASDQKPKIVVDDELK